MSTLEGAQGRENGLILGAQNLIALGIDPNDANAKTQILKSLSREYRAEKRQGNTNLSQEAFIRQRIASIGDQLDGGAGIEPVLDGNIRAKSQAEIDDDAANGLFQQDQLAEDSYTPEDRDSFTKKRTPNPNNVAGFNVPDGISIEKKARSLEFAAERSDDQEFKDRVATFREDAKTQSYGLRAAEDGSTYDATDEPTLVDVQNTTVGNPHLNQELQGQRQRLRDANAAAPFIAADRSLSNPETKADNALSSFLESRLLRNQERQDDEFVNTIRAIRGLGPEPVRTNVEDLGGGGVLDTNYGRSWEVSRTAVPGLRGESAYVDSVSGEPVKTTANSPDSAQALNAPQPSRADKALQDFIGPRLFDSSMDKNGAPTAYREVNISQITNDFYRRLGKTPTQGAPLIDSFQEELRDRARKGGVFYDDPIKLDNGETYRPAVGGDSGRPVSINAVLNSLNYEPYEKDQLANALYQELTARRTTNANTEAPITFGDTTTQYGRPSIDFRSLRGTTSYQDDDGTTRRIPGDDLKAAQERIIGAVPGNYTRPSTGKSTFRQEPYETRRVYLNKETGKGYTPREAMQRAEDTGRDQYTAYNIGRQNASLRRDQKATEESNALRRFTSQSTIRQPVFASDGKPRSTMKPGTFGGPSPVRAEMDNQFIDEAKRRADARDTEASMQALQPRTEGGIRRAPVGAAATAITGAEPASNITPLPSAVQPVQNAGSAAVPDTTGQQAKVPAKPNPGGGPLPDMFSKERRRRTIAGAAGGLAGLGLGIYALNQQQEREQV